MGRKMFSSIVSSSGLVTIAMFLDEVKTTFALHLSHGHNKQTKKHATKINYNFIFVSCQIGEITEFKKKILMRSIMENEELNMS